MHSLHLHLRRLRYRLLCWISPSFRESSHWQSLYDLETQHHHTAKARTANAESRLAEAQDQIKTLTFAAQSAARDADRYRRARDTARKRENIALRQAVNKLDPIVDVLALRAFGQQIYGSLPANAHAPEPPLVEPIPRGMHARQATRQRTREVLLEEIERTQESLRNGMNGVGEPPAI